jgi:hypothetical protein
MESFATVGRFLTDRVTIVMLEREAVMRPIMPDLVIMAMVRVHGLMTKVSGLRRGGHDGECKRRGAEKSYHGGYSVLGWVYFQEMFRL